MKNKFLRYTLSKETNIPSSKLSFYDLAMRSVITGFYVALATALLVLVSADTSRYLGTGLTKITMGIAFSSGIIVAMLSGGELFAANDFTFAGVVTKQISPKYMLKKWTIVYFSNFVGVLILAFIMYYAYLWKLNGYLPGIEVLTLANVKAHNFFGASLFRGIGCGWLICLAAQMAITARNTIGKIYSVLIPVTILIALGFEYSVSNMYFASMGFMLKTTKAASASGLDLSGFTMGSFLINNLIPVTLGNIIGSAAFSGSLVIYAKKTKEK